MAQNTQIPLAVGVQIKSKKSYLITPTIKAKNNKARLS